MRRNQTCLAVLLVSLVLVGSGCGTVEKSLANGESCSGAGECESGYCVDGVCCDQACDSGCEACSPAVSGGTHAAGVCSPIPSGSDPLNACYFACDGSGACEPLLPAGADCSDSAACADGHCVDSICCTAACDGVCESCLAAFTGGTDGQCSFALPLSDPNSECPGGLGCDGEGAMCMAAKSWGTAGKVQNEPEGSLQALDIASGADGTVVATWDSFNSTASRIDVWVARHVDGGWTGVQAVGNPTASISSGRPAVAVNGRGDAIVVWQNNGPSGGNMVFARHFDSGAGQWSSNAVPIDLAVTNSNARNYASVGIDDNGNAIAVWLQQSPTSPTQYHLYFNTFDWATKLWGTAAILSGPADVKTPALAVNKSGVAVAVWVFGNRVMSKYYQPGTGWVAELPVNDTGLFGAFDPKVGVDASGAAIVVWQQRESDTVISERRIFASHLNPSAGTWGNPLPLDASVTANSASPVLAVNGVGQAMALWYRGSTDELWGATYNPGTGSWDAAIKIQGNELYPWNKDVAIDANGNVMAVWRAYHIGDDRYNAFARRYVPGTGWGSVEIITPSLHSGIEDIAVALDGRGSATALWQQSDGSRQKAWTNRYE